MPPIGLRLILTAVGLFSNASLPMLPQMTLMTDAQMRTAFASLDPLAGSH
jgi:hypothetical protein